MIVSNRTIFDTFKILKHKKRSLSICPVWWSDQPVLKWNAQVLARMALLMNHSRSVFPLRSAKTRELESCGGKKCARAPWTFSFKMA